MQSVKNSFRYISVTFIGPGDVPRAGIRRNVAKMTAYATFSNGLSKKSDLTLVIGDCQNIVQDVIRNHDRYLR